MKIFLFCLLFVTAVCENVRASTSASDAARAAILSPWQKFLARCNPDDKAVAYRVLSWELNEAMSTWVTTNGGPAKFLGEEVKPSDRLARLEEEKRVLSVLKSRIIDDFATFKAADAARLAAAPPPAPAGDD